MTATRGMPVGESLPFFLIPTTPPRWSAQPLENWRKERGTVVRLQLECFRDGWDPWSLPCEVDTTDIRNVASVSMGPVTVEVP